MKIFPKPPHSDTFPERSDNRKYFCVRRLHSQEIQFDPSINFFSVNLLQQKREKFAGSQPTWMARLRWKSKASFLARVLFALVSTTCFRNLACTNILTSKKNWLYCTHYTRMNCSKLNSSGAFLSRLFHVLTTWNWIVSLLGSHRLCLKILSIILLSVTFEKKKRHLRKKLCQKFSLCAIKFGKIRGVRFTP